MSIHAMSIHEWLVAIEGSAISHSISKSNHLVGAGLNIVHVFGIILLLAALVLLSLRLLGLALRSQAIATVSRDAQRLMNIGFVLAIVSGVLMFVSAPRLYYYNPAFQLKMGLFAVALIVQFLLLRRAATRDFPFARVSASFALLLWFGVGFSGRIIAFI